MFDENLDYPQFCIASVGLLSVRRTDLQPRLNPLSQRLEKTILFPERIKVFYRSLSRIASKKCALFLRQYDR
jgi:hypothetical protein